MKFYIVQRDLNNVGWDEYDSYVIYAHNKAEALEVAIERYKYFDEKETTVTPIKKTREAQIVHESFNAG